MTKISESRIREIIRFAVKRRMLSEADDSMWARQDPTGPGRKIDYTSLTRGSASPEETAAPSIAGINTQTDEEDLSGLPSQDTTFAEASKGDPVQKISDLVSAEPDIDTRTGRKYVGPSLGEGIVRFMNEIEGSYIPVSLSDPKAVMSTWRRLYGDVRPVEILDENGDPTGEEIEFTPDARGLLLYLICLKTAQLGRVLIAQDIEAKDEKFKEISRVAEVLKEKISGWTDQLDIKDMIDTFRNFVLEDRTRGMFDTRLLLAKFAEENWTTYETLGVAGDVVLLMSAAYAALGTGGAATPLAAGIASTTVFADLFGLARGVVTGLTRLGSLAAGARLTGVGARVIGSIAYGWHGGLEIADAVSNSAYYKLAQKLQDTSELEELSLELDRTWGAAETSEALLHFRNAVREVFISGDKSRTLQHLDSASRVAKSF